MVKRLLQQSKKVFYKFKTKNLKTWIMNIKINKKVLKYECQMQKPSIIICEYK